MKTLFGLLVLVFVSQAQAVELGREIVCEVKTGRSSKVAGTKVIPMYQEFYDIGFVELDLLTKEKEPKKRHFYVTFSAFTTGLSVSVYDDDNRTPQDDKYGARNSLGKVGVAQSDNLYLTFIANETSPIDPKITITCKTRPQTQESANLAKLQQDNYNLFSTYSVMSMFNIYPLKEECARIDENLVAQTEALVAFIRATEFEARIKTTTDAFEAAYKSMRELCTDANYALPNDEQELVLQELKKRQNAAQALTFSITHPGELAYTAK